ncbi:protein SSUH2 homolog [Engystomops pustulosus]|uniref:protein SSUH2 homolog n=1 Tax=Engystomops pustulosus TaxID=76066 RepID=UPI003AFB5C38
MSEDIIDCPYIRIISCIYITLLLLDNGQNNPGYEEESPEGDGNEYTGETFESPTEEDNTIGSPHLSVDEARQSFLEYAEKHCCYSSSPAEEMTIDNIEPLDSYRYCLATFIEERTLKPKSRPYKGEELDGPSNGPAPRKWDVKVNCPEWFVDNKVKVIVPRTSEVERCPKCGGSGRVRCVLCDGNGTKDCQLCFGTGENFQGFCHTCNGEGTTNCYACHSTGKIMCTTCIGQGKIVTYQQLKVIWRNLEQYVQLFHDESEFPYDRFQKVSGQTLFSDEDTEVQPITSICDGFFEETSQEAINQHAALSNNSRIVRQSHTVESLLLHKVHYTWGGNQGHYYVYGLENKAYCGDYPKQCCCVIL